MEPDVRDAVVDYVRAWRERTELPWQFFLTHLVLRPGKFHSWKKRYGKDNAHNGNIPKDYWLLPEEKASIIRYYQEHPQDGYRSITYQMMDKDIVAVSPSTTYRVLKKEGLLTRWSKPTKKGKGFEQPLAPHEHWHTDISYLNLSGTFYYFSCVLDGCSRKILHWDIMESMTEADVEILIQATYEKYPGNKPRLITDNGSCYIAHDFKQFVKVLGITHVRTSPYYPQSNGKVERFHQSLKKECIRPKTPLTLEDAKRLVASYVDEYNTRRLHSALGWVTPQDRIEGRHLEIYKERDRKLEAARDQRKAQRELAYQQRNEA